MTNLNCEKISLHRRQTRWDQMKRKYTTNSGEVMMKSPFIKHLIEMDFIRKDQCRYPITDDNTKNCLNPILVMNLRHEMFRKVPKKLSNAKSIHLKTVDSCYLHNRVVENHYLNKQLQDCRERLAKNYKCFRIPTNQLQSLLNENSVMKNLHVGKQCISNCYTTFVSDGNECRQEVHKMIKVNLKIENTNALGLLWHDEAVPIKMRLPFSLNKHKRVPLSNQLSVFEKVIHFINTNNNSTEQSGKCFITTECCEEDSLAHYHQSLNNSKIPKVCQSTVPVSSNMLSFLELGVKSETDKNLLKFKSHNSLEQSKGTLNLNHSFPTQIYGTIPSENICMNENFFKYTKNLICNRSEQFGSTEFENEHAKNNLINNNQEQLIQTLEEIETKELYPLFSFFCFNDEVGIYKFHRENSSYSVNNNVLDSITLELVEEDLTELQMEGDTDTIVSNNNKYDHSNNQDIQGQGVDEGANVILSGCLQENPCNANILVIFGKTSYFVKNVKNQNIYIDHIEKSHEIDEGVEELNSMATSKEQMQTIGDLFQSGIQSNHDTVRKYFLKWMHYINVEKIEREYTDSSTNRIKKINTFLNKVSKKKELLQTTCLNLNSNVKEGNINKRGNFSNDIIFTKKYQNKIKIQQDIIELQKVKLERQERIIMELKLGKLSEETKAAKQQLKEDLRNILRTGNPKFRTKAKCLQLVGNLKDTKYEKIEHLQGKALVLPKFLQRMQERALERSIKHEQAKQRRLHIEAEREALKLAQEESKRLENEESRRNRLAALNEKRRQEKLEKIQKAKDRQLAADNLNKASLFYRHLLLRRVGMEGFKLLLKRKRNIEIECKQLSRSICQKYYFHIWLTLYYISKARSNQKADDFFERMIKRVCLQMWLKYIEEEKSKMNVAIDWREWKLSEHIFKIWLANTKHMLLIEETKMKQASSHYEWHTKWKVLDRWQHLSQILRIEKETERRRQKWRMKIWELLPDYKPNRDELDHM